MKKSTEEGINLRLQKLIEELTGGNVSKFARISGINEQTCHTFVKGRLPNTEALYGICENFNVNINWLLTGEGQKRRDDGEEKPLKNKFLMQVADWLEDVARRDPRKPAWFELQFESLFPEFKSWLLKQRLAEGDQHRRAV
jgi:hypothetical protein